MKREIIMETLSVLYAVNAGWRDKVFADADCRRIAERYRVIEAPVPETADTDFLTTHIGEANVVITCWDNGAKGSNRSITR